MLALISPFLLSGDFSSSDSATALIIVVVTAVMLVTIAISVVISTIVQFGLAVIPMMLGKKKGYNPVVCYFYGVFTFFPALFTVLFLPALPAAGQPEEPDDTYSAG